MEMICIRFHSSDRLNYQKHLGFDCEPETFIEKIIRGRIKFNCYDYPQDDEYTELLYMQCENRKANSKVIFDFLLNCLHSNSNLLIEIFACDNQLVCDKMLFSNANCDLYYGYDWRTN